MSLRLYNTLTRTEEEFTPLDAQGRCVKLYCCGPTVYDFAHIGNFRAFIFEDLLRRHLEARGFEVLHVMNITDVEDKIIRSIHASGESLQTLTRRYEEAFLQDLQTLGCLLPKQLPRATEHVSDMIRLIQRLEEKGLAYRANDGSVYFSIEKFAAYGKLARLDREQLKPGARVSQDEYEREAYGDFVLWKARADRDGDVAWESPWGRGRPGWHIECSCMSMKHLGETLDIHCGGEDLIFPHHEDEIAQSEAATGKPFARFWLHNAHLLVNGQKMSKSEGNFFTVRDLLGRGFVGREIRYALISAHYRLPLNFTLEGLNSARHALQRIDAWVGRLRQVASESSVPPLSPTRATPKPIPLHPGASSRRRGTEGGQSSDLGRLSRTFLDSLDGDLNISGALGHLFDAVRESNRAMDEGSLSHQAAAELLQEWETVERVVGLTSEFSLKPPVAVEDLARQREAARGRKDWKASDDLRKVIEAQGWAIQDSPGGYKLTPH